MALTTTEKSKLFKQYGKSEKNTGSAEGQVAVFSKRISELTEHLKLNKKDFGTQRALLNMVGKRKALLNYLKSKDIARYREIIKELNIRK